MTRSTEMTWLCIALLGMGGCGARPHCYRPTVGRNQRNRSSRNHSRYQEPGHFPDDPRLHGRRRTDPPSGDSRGAYTSGECGVNAYTVVGAANDLAAHMWPAASTPAASCGGARSATVRMLVRHVSDDPHVDDDTNPVGDLVLGNIAVGVNGVAKINAPTLACFHSSRGGKGMSGIGMRFNTAAYPGSSYLNVTVTGDRLWHIETAPWPNNIGYCEGDLWKCLTGSMNLSLDITPAN